MKVEVWNEQKPATEEPIRLRLFQHEDRVTLDAVGADGRCLLGGVLLGIKTDGTGYTCCGVSPGLGFKLDVRGRLVVNDGE